MKRNKRHETILQLTNKPLQLVRVNEPYVAIYTLYVISQTRSLFSDDRSQHTSQEQYWAGRTPRPNNGTPNMAAANFV